MGGGVAKMVFLAASLGWLTAAAIFSAPQASAPDKVSFSRDVLPILADKCFKCHGPDASSRMANLRLDDPAVAFADRGGRWPILPGKPEHSLVVKRINQSDDRMPPPYSGKSLSKQEIATITQWIAEGAHYGKLWSFEPLPASVPVPQIKSDWPRDDIDRFILARLKREGVSPSPQASRLRWLRRVTYDLTGLPPTERDISAFAGDSRKDAYERVVDRLLASPRFGERVAVEWLDAARYSDSYGYQSDLLMPSWPYRDWVVKSFNQNLPYDQFLTDQIAGDLLPSPTRDQRLATAFNRLHRQSNEGGSIALEFKTEYAVDRTSTFGTAVLGLTVGCARCHDHKFDPISQKEFYQLYAYFNSIEEYGLLLSTDIVPTPSLLLPTAAQETRLTELQAANEAASRGLNEAVGEAGPRYEQWLASKPSAVIPDLVGRFSLDSEDGGKFPSEIGKAFGAKLGQVESVPGHSGKAALFDGDNGLAFRGLPGRERWDAFTWSFWISDPRRPGGPVVLQHRTGGTDVGFCGFDLTLEDGYLTARVMRAWPGNAVAVRSWSRVPKGEWAHVAWSWDGSGRASGLKIYLNGKPAETKVLADKIWKRINAYGDLGPSGGDWAFGQRFRDAGFKGGKLDDVAFASRALSSLEVTQLFDGRSLAAALGSGGDLLSERGLPAGSGTPSVGSPFRSFVAPRGTTGVVMPHQLRAEAFGVAMARQAASRSQIRGSEQVKAVARHRTPKRFGIASSKALRARGKALASDRTPKAGRWGSALLRDYFVNAIDFKARAARDAVRKAQEALTNFEEGIYEVPVMEESPTPIPAYLLARGQYDAPRNEKTRVTRNVPKVLPPLKNAGRNDRLALARWATRPDHPLTARVAVNRFWQMIFGVGLVETSENFGMQGSRPTHPELLDYLARRFVRSGWDVKKLLRSMVLSSTYRQDSVRSAKLLKIDPLNKLLARGPSQRLPAEMMRDTVLAASGLLNLNLGGAPVNPYQPAGIWQENNTMSPPFVQSKGADLYRRSLYSTWKRTTPVPSMMLFDATSREACTIRRPTTNTPLQALVLLNDMQFVEACRVLAERVLGLSDSDRVRSVFRRLTGREPDGRELSILLAVLREQRALFKADPGSAAKLIAVGESKASGSLDPVELAAMTVTVQTVLNSDAVVWKR